MSEYRFRAVISMIVVLVSFLTICGCTRKGQETKIVLRFSAGSYPDYDVWRRKLARDFEKLHPEVRVRYEPVSGTSYWGKILTQMAGKTTPDVIWMGGSMIPVFVNRNALVDLTPFIESDDEISLDEYLPQAVEEYEFAGGIYALPHTVCPFVMYYNKKIFDNAHIPYPDDTWDWRKYREIAQKLTKKGPDGRIIQYGGCISLNWYNIVAFTIQNGGHLFNEDKSKCIINSPEALESARFFYDLANVDRTIPRYIDYESSNAYQMFMNGKIATLHEARWVTFLLRQRKDLDWGVVLQPKGKIRTAALGGHGWAITSQCKHKQLAYELLKKIVGKEGVRFISRAGDAVPVMKALLHEDEFLHPPEYPDEDNTIYLRAVEYAYSGKQLYHPLIPSDQMRNLGDMEFQKFFLGKQTAEEMLKTVEDKLNEMLKGES